MIVDTLTSLLHILSTPRIGVITGLNRVIHIIHSPYYYYYCFFKKIYMYMLRLSQSSLDHRILFMSKDGERIKEDEYETSRKQIGFG